MSVDIMVVDNNSTLARMSFRQHCGYQGHMKDGHKLLYKGVMFEPY